MTETFLRIAEVERVTGLPRATIYEMANASKFPRQVRLYREPSAGSNQKFQNGRRRA